MSFQADFEENVNVRKSVPKKTFFEGLRVLDGKRHRFCRVQRSQFIQGA